MIEIMENTPQLLLWKDADGNRFNEDHVFHWVATAKHDLSNEYQIIVGTDSHMHDKTYKFISVICIYRVGKGGNYFYLETHQPKDAYVGGRGKRVKGNQKLRLFDEVIRSCELATSLFEKTGILPVIHIDASPAHQKEFTSEFSDQLKGYVTSNGFECVLKPNSFVANAVADKHSK